MKPIVNWKVDETLCLIQSIANIETKDKAMSKLVVIDTETTWGDAVMSVGIVIADAVTFELIDKWYYILTPFKDHGGMYT